MTKIHQTAIIDPGAKLASDVTVGPFCCVGADVEIGAGSELVSHVVVAGRTTVGKNNKIYPFACIGLAPQDLKYGGEPSRLVIGHNNVLREYVTMNPGTDGGGMVTEVGDNGLFMIGAHVAHDCKVGNHVIMANNATLAGHIHVGDHAIIGGLAAVHQFVRIGHHAMIGGLSAVDNDVIPYGSVVGDRAKLMGLNIVGLKRNTFSRDIIHDLRTAYRLLFAEEGTFAERITDVSGMYAKNTPVMEIVTFMSQESSRGLCQPRSGRGA